MLVVNKEISEFFAGRSLALSYLVFVMGEYQIDSAGMYIERLAKIFCAHGAALYMPTGPSNKIIFTDFEIPARLIVLFCLPENKVLGIFFTVFISINPGAIFKAP